MVRHIVNPYLRTPFLTCRTLLYALPLMVFSFLPDPYGVTFLKGKVLVLYTEWYAQFREFVANFHRGSRCYSGVALLELDKEFRPTDTMKDYFAQQAHEETVTRLLAEQKIHPLSPQGRHIRTTRF